jgi:glycosyltransferase involved in cell wall biosynthesis
MLNKSFVKNSFVDKDLFYGACQSLSIERYQIDTIEPFENGIILGSGDHQSICELVKICKRVSPNSRLSLVASKHLINELSKKEFNFIQFIEYPCDGLLKWDLNPEWWKQILNQNFDSLFFYNSQETLLGAQNILEILHISNTKNRIHFIDQEGKVYGLSQSVCSASLHSISMIDQLAGLERTSTSSFPSGSIKRTVLFDSRILGEKNQTGVHRYARELINYLPIEIPEIQFNSIGSPTIHLPEDINRIPVSLPASDLTRANHLISVTSKLEEPDIIFSPYHPLPKDRHGVAVLTIHDLIPLKHTEWFSNQNTINFFDQSLRESALHVDKIIADSNSTKQDIINIYGVDESKIEVIYLAAKSIFCTSDHNLHSEEHFHIANGRPYFLSVCTQEPRKNIDGVIKAYELLRKQNPALDPALVLVGKKGWKNEELEKVLNESNFKDSIFITGYIEDNTLVNAYREAIAFIYPSFYEGFGLPVLEAMACGTPVITSNNSSLAEIGQDSVLYCDPASYEDISFSMCKIISDSVLKENLANRGLKRASEFSWKKTAQKTAQVITSLLN